MSPKPDAVLLTCEHAGNQVPREFRHCFAGQAAVLASHRGWDPGALPIARRLARLFQSPLLVYPYTRLLIEPNRSPGHPALYSAFTRDLPREARAALRDAYYLPHRGAVEEAVAARLHRGGRVLHLAVHSFTPVLDGTVRHADLGLLYDPKRSGERALCTAWQSALRAQSPTLRVRRNYPYRGAADGLTTHLRRLFPDGAYLGIEIEVNQALATVPARARDIAAHLHSTCPAFL